MVDVEKASSPVQPSLSSRFNSQHSENYSNYQGENRVGNETPDMSERVSMEEKEGRDDGSSEETIQVQGETANVQDLEAPLERRASAKSAKTKDPNLVCMLTESSNKKMANDSSGHMG